MSQSRGALYISLSLKQAPLLKTTESMVVFESLKDGGRETM